MQIKNLNKSFWTKVLFDKAGLNLNKGEKAWLVGINGSGKSTIFKILSWEDLNFQGEIIHDTKSPLIGYMHQNSNIINSDISIGDFFKSYTWIGKVEEELNMLMNNLEDEGNLEKYSEIYELFEKIWWYEFEYKAEKIINQIWLHNFSLESNIKFLSWWEKRKILLCATILKGGDLILLDEPTNDLDSKSIEWLTESLKDSLASCLIISHDTDFLNKIVKKIFEIDNKNINQYSWNYNFFESQKYLEYEKNKNLYERQIEEEKRIKKQSNELKQKAQNIGNTWNKRDNDKWDWASKVEKKLAQRAKALENRIDRIEKIDKPTHKRHLQIEFSCEQSPLGKIEINNLNIQHTESNFKLQIKELVFNKDDKVLLYWDNWSGKSTFLKSLLSVSNNITYKDNIKIHPSLNIWYFDQEQDYNQNEHLSPIEFLHENLGFSLESVHSALWNIGFNEYDKNQKICLLSPWMQLRIQLAKIILNKNNCIILDEPTNHIDVETKEALKNAINSFNWLVIIVSHDKKFINSLHLSKKINFTNWSIIES